MLLLLTGFCAFLLPCYPPTEIKSAEEIRANGRMTEAWAIGAILIEMLCFSPTAANSAITELEYLKDGHNLLEQRLKCIKDRTNQVTLYYCLGTFSATRAGTGTPARRSICIRCVSHAFVLCRSSIANH